MKPTSGQSLGAGQTNFQFFPYFPQTVNQTPAVTQPPGVPPGHMPVMRVISQQSPTQSVWQSNIHGRSAAPLPPGPAQAEMTQTFITAQADELRTAIHARNEKLIQTILASPHINEIAMAADAQGKHAVFHAIENNDLFTLDFLLRLPSANALALKRSGDGRIALDAAAATGSVVAVHLLLSLSSAHDQVMVSTEEGHRRLEGNSLTAAVLLGHENVVRVLLASPYAPALVHGRSDDGSNALMVAVLMANEPLTRVLLASPYCTALVQAKNHSGANALYDAGLVGHVGVARALLEHEDVRWQLLASDTPVKPLDIAIFKGHQGVADLFRQQIAMGMRVHLGSVPVADVAPRQ